MKRLLIAFFVAGLCNPVAAWSAPSITYVRNVQNLPIAGNNGGVFGGGDVGWSTRFGTTTSYFFFGDTDRYGRTDDVVGTFAAKTTDTNMADGFSVTYRIENESSKFGTGTAKKILDASFPNEECVWPQGAIANINDFKMYLYYSGNMSNGSPCNQTLGVGIAQVTGDLDATRLGGYLFNGSDPVFSLPFLADQADGCGGVNEFVFLAGLSAGTDVYLTRVAPGSIANRAQYTFWGRSTPGGALSWLGNIAYRVPIFTDSNIGNAVSIAYNATMDRYIAVYSCGLNSDPNGEGICARWTNQTGPDASALVSNLGWSVAHRIYTATLPPDGLFTAVYQAAQHPQFASGSKIYISSARNNGQGYGVTYREFQVTP